MAALEVRAGRSCAAVPDIRAGGLPEVLMAVRRLRSARGGGRRARCVCATRRALPPIRSSPPFRPWWRWPPNFMTGWANPSKPVNPWVSNRSTGLHYGLGGLVQKTHKTRTMNRAIARDTQPNRAKFSLSETS